MVGNLSKKSVISIFLTASLIAGCTAFTSANAATVLKDGTYTQTVKVSPDEYEDFDAYDLTVDVEIVKGSVSSISIPDSNTYGGVRANKNYVSDASGIEVSGIKTVEELESVDAVSEATCASNAIKEAVKMTLSEAETEIDDDEYIAEEDEEPEENDEFIVTEEDAVFEDVQNENKYYYVPVYWAVQNGITSGTSKTEFTPNAGCTRGQIMVFIWRANGSPEATTTLKFTDVKEGSVYYKAIQWAVENGITAGTTATTYSPSQICTRAQIMTFLWKSCGSPKTSGKVNFDDVKTTNYYYQAVQWAVKNSITSGTTETAFSPDKTCTRGQAVTFIYKASKINE